MTVSWRSSTSSRLFSRLCSDNTSGSSSSRAQRLASRDDVPSSKAKRVALRARIYWSKATLEARSYSSQASTTSCRQTAVSATSKARSGASFTMAVDSSSFERADSCCRWLSLMATSS